MSDPAALYWPSIQQERWYSGKSRKGVPGAHIALPWYGDSRVRSELVRIDYPDGSHEWYHLPVVYTADERPGYGRTPLGWACDATADSAAMSAMFHAIQANQTTNGLRCRSRGADVLDPSLNPRRHTGEQSNTSVFFGDAAMLKVFRKLESGRNLDIDMHEVLAASGSVARLYGWIAAGEYDLAMLIEALAQPVDGYALATSAVGRDFSSEIGGVVRALANVHHGLAEAMPTSERQGRDLANIFISRATDAAAEVPQLRDHLAAATRLFATMADRCLPVQRLHGDFHLGQTLLTPHGWRIVDFEGEPMKTMDERRSPDSIWRDVAGLLRSIDYAAATSDHPHVANWQAHTRESFIAAYCEAMKVSPDPVLLAYEIDKAIYEVVYEARNRPHLIGVPLSFITTTLKEN